MIVIPSGSLMIVDSTQHIGMLLKADPSISGFQYLYNEDIFFVLEDVRHEHCENVWQHMKILTRFGPLLAPAWMIRERACVLVKSAET